jgi:uncharacterized protein DUF5994
MSTITENITAARAFQPAIGRVRLRLKPAHRSCGFVQGAWWPRSTLLTDELPSLLAALSLRFGTIDRVVYHESDWSPAPQRIEHHGGELILDASQVSSSVISVVGKQFGRMSLLVVPPYTDATDAYAAVTTAAGANDASTPDQLLGIGARSTEDPRPRVIALQRWESEGGALRPASPSRLPMQDENN